MWMLDSYPKPESFDDAHSFFFFLITVAWFTLNSFNRVNKEYYVAIWRRLREAICRNRQYMWTEKFLIFCTILRRHILVRLWLTFLVQCETRVIAQPLCSTDLDPGGFFLPPSWCLYKNIGLYKSMLEFARNAPILKAILNFCIKIHENIFFFVSPSESWSVQIIIYLLTYT